MSTKKEETNIQDVDINLTELLGTGVDSVMLPGEKEDKPKSIFSPMNPDTKFLDKIEKPVEKPAVPENETDEEKTIREEAEAAEAEAEASDKDDDFLKPPADVDEDLDEDLDKTPKNKGGRPSMMVAATKKLNEKGLLQLFDDEEKKLEDYTETDFEELYEANIQNMQAQMPKQFMDSLPPELQKAYHYISNGGQDIKGIFREIASSEDTKALDISLEKDQKAIVRAYLQSTKWGTPEEIEDEIYSYEDAGTLEKRAGQFKPKLDAKQDDIIKQKLIVQQQNQEKRQAQSQDYMDNVYSILEKGNLNGLAIDNKTQNMLYAGLVQSNYSSANGPTNMLGHLLEQHQWVKPRHDLIAEALWLLADPENYRKSVASQTEQTINKKTLKTLKTEQVNKGGHAEEEEQEIQSRKRAGLQKPKKNFFKF